MVSDSFCCHHRSLFSNYPPTVYRTLPRLWPLHRTQQVTQVKEVKLMRKVLQKWRSFTVYFIYQPVSKVFPSSTCCYFDFYLPSFSSLKPCSYLHSSFTFRHSALHKRTVTPALTQPTRANINRPLSPAAPCFLLSSLQFIDGRQRSTVGAEISRWLTALSSHHQALVKHKHQHAQICDEGQGRGVI